jgi:hypothetical protein
MANNGNLSTEFDMRKYAGGRVYMPDDWDSASIGFKVCSTRHGTYQIARDDDGNLIQIDSPVADNSYSFPAALWDAFYVKLWSQDGSGNDTAQTPARTFTVTLKA